MREPRKRHIFPGPSPPVTHLYSIVGGGDGVAQAKSNWALLVRGRKLPHIRHQPLGVVALDKSHAIAPAVEQICESMFAAGWLPRSRKGALLATD